LAYVSAIALICAGVKDDGFACASSVAPMTNASSHGMITSRFIVALWASARMDYPNSQTAHHISLPYERADEIARRRALVMISAPTPGESLRDREPCCLGEGSRHGATGFLCGGDNSTDFAAPKFFPWILIR